MDLWSTKHVEPPSVMNKQNHWTLCVLLDCIYIAENYSFCFRKTVKKLSLSFLTFFCSAVHSVHVILSYHSAAIKYFYLSKITSRECTQLWVLCSCHCNGRSDFRDNTSVSPAFFHVLPSPYNICFIHVNADMSGDRNEPLTSVWIIKRDLLETAC